MFNDEELLFLNRIAFYLLSKEGVSLHFNDFIKELKVLQDGKFEDQVDLILSMMMGGRSEQKMFIEIDSLICFVMSSMPQQRPMKTNVEELLNEQFEQGFQQVKVDRLSVLPFQPSRRRGPRAPQPRVVLDRRVDH